MSLLEVKDLSVEYVTSEGNVKALNGVNLSLDQSVSMGLVGETGAGKTTLALSLLKLLPNKVGRVTGGSIEFDGIDLLGLSESKIQEMRGNRIAMIFQNPLTSLNPVFTIGDQLCAVLQRHRRLSRKQAVPQAGNLLEMVGIPRTRVDNYPHEFSGGMRQRVGIAIALACNPSLLIADEPTTALDVTIQAQVLDLMGELKKNFKGAMVMITHNLGIVAQTCEQISVMYAGRIVERGSVKDVFSNPCHPYTVGLINSLPDVHHRKDRLEPIPGLMPNPLDLPEGCVFWPRCKMAVEQCQREIPKEVDLGNGHNVCCHRHSA